MAVIVAHKDDCAIVLLGTTYESPVYGGFILKPTMCSCGGLLIEVEVRLTASETPRHEMLPSPVDIREAGNDNGNHSSLT